MWLIHSAPVIVQPPLWSTDRENTALLNGARTPWKLERPCQLNHIDETENNVLPTGNAPEFWPCSKYLWARRWVKLKIVDRDLLWYPSPRLQNSNGPCGLILWSIDLEMVPPWVIFVPHMNIIHEIGNVTTKHPWGYKSSSKVIARDTASHAGDHLC